MPNVKLKPCLIIKSCVTARGPAETDYSLHFKVRAGPLGCNVLFAPGWHSSEAAECGAAANPPHLPARTQPHSNCCHEQPIMGGCVSWGQHQPNDLANTVAAEMVSSNHASADHVCKEHHRPFYFIRIWGFPSVAVSDCAVGPRGSVCGAVWVLTMFPFLSLLSTHSWKQHRDLSSPIDTGVSKNSLYTRTTNYIDAESPHLPKDLDHSLGIAREEVWLKFWFGSLPLLFVFCLSSFHFIISSSFSDCHKGERSAGVEEEV